MLRRDESLWRGSRDPALVWKISPLLCRLNAHYIEGEQGWWWWFDFLATERLDTMYKGRSFSLLGFYSYTGTMVAL